MHHMDGEQNVKMIIREGKEDCIRLEETSSRIFLVLARQHLRGEIAPDQVPAPFQQRDADTACSCPHFKDACPFTGNIQQGLNTCVCYRVKQGTGLIVDLGGLVERTAGFHNFLYCTQLTLLIPKFPRRHHRREI